MKRSIRQGMLQKVTAKQRTLIIMTHAPTTKMTSVRALMQLAAQKDYIVHQMDVKTAYLNAPIDCDI